METFLFKQRLHRGVCYHVCRHHDIVAVALALRPRRQIDCGAKRAFPNSPKT